MGRSFIVSCLFPSSEQKRKEQKIKRRIKKEKESESKSKGGLLIDIDMEVTIVDSKPAVVSLLDSLDGLPTQPPSLYLDIEGVNLSRHGSISILQLFVPPRNRVFLIDVFVLKEAAFLTASNRSGGTDLRSILESAQVPKVFFDVRNDSDALFAHFRISMQGIQDVQLLEVATRSFSRDRVSGLTTCIRNDARLSPKALAVWKATKQKGRSLFSPEDGGDFEVFNSRPIPQDIVDYCTQDVVYLPVLWKIYTQKISVKWMGKVQIETSERVLESQKASYEPHSRDKTWSPWAKTAEAGPQGRPGTSEAKVLGKKSVVNISQTTATEAPKKAAAKEPDLTVVAQTTDLRTWRSAAAEAAEKTQEMTEELERPLSRIKLAVRGKKELEPGLSKKKDPVLFPGSVQQKWTCKTCGREMQEFQKEDHVRGTQHIARVKQRRGASYTNAPKQKTLQAKTAIMKNHQPGTLATEASSQRNTYPETTQDASSKGKEKKKKQATKQQPPQEGLAYPPDYLFHGFQERAVPRNYRYETLWSLDDVNYSICDSECGWCGHCMDGVDI